MEAAKLKIQLDQTEESCRAYVRIWQELLEEKNGGKLTRADADFIVTKLLEITAAKKASLLGGPNAPHLANAAAEAGIRMDGIVGSVRRDLEIRIRRQQAFPTGNSKTIRTDDYRFAKLALDEARKSVSEADDKPHPKVGAVVVKDGQVISVAHRGEVLGNHAEFVALEKKLADSPVAGATVYTTLEPCTTRNHPKIPCAERLVERRVGRVVI